MKRIVQFYSVILALLLLTSVIPLIAEDQKEVLIIGTTDSIRNLDPSDAYDYFSSNILVQITHGLMEMPIDGTDAVKGPIVNSFFFTNDARVYVFELKTGITFSDGEVFDANAMKWLLDRSIALQGDPGFLLADVVDNITAANQTLTINLITPDATFLQRLTYTIAWPVSPISLQRDIIQGDINSIPAGLGPYMVTSWTKGVELVLEANPNYFGAPPETDKIIIKFYRYSSSLLRALETGEIDLAHNQFGPDEIKSINVNNDLKSVSEDTAGIRYLILNVEQHPEIMVRQAIAASVDRESITSTIFNNLNEPIYTMVPKIFSSSNDSFSDGSQTVVDALMAETEYTNTNKYAMDFWYSPSHYGKEEAEIAGILASQLEATGYFDVTIRTAEWSAYVGQFETMGFFLLGWWFDYPDPSNYIDPFAGAGAFSLGTNYTSTVMDSYLKTMLTNTDPSARATAQIDAQNLMAEDVMVVPLFSMLKQFSAMQKSVMGYNLELSQNVHYNSISVFGLTSDSNSTNDTQIIIAVILVVLFGATFWFLRGRKTTDTNKTRSVKTTRLSKEKTTQVRGRFCRGCGTRDDYQGTFCSECGITL